MNKYSLFKSASTLCLLVLLLIPAVAFSQNVEGVTDVDAAFEEARQMAFSGEHEEARKMAYTILEIVPDYHDVRVLIARTYSWDGRYTESRRELAYVLDDEPDNREALIASIDTEIWSDNPQEAIQFAAVATRYYPIDVPILLKSANAHHLAGENREAARILNRVDDISPANREAADLRELIEISSQNYKLTGTFTHDRYSDFFDPTEEGLVELSRRSSYGTLFGRLNYGNRFDTVGFQPEIDFYPTISDGWYGYLNVGIANSIIFPEFRAGAELHRRVGETFEASLGLRFLRFPNSDVIIYTGTVTKYQGNWLFILRPYLATSSDVGTSRSVQLMGRRFYSGPDNHITFRGGFGFSPEDRRFQNESGDINFTKSQFILVEGLKAINSSVGLIASIEYTRRELSFSPDEFIGIISLRGGIQLKF